MKAYYKYETEYNVNAMNIYNASNTDFLRFVSEDVVFKNAISDVKRLVMFDCCFETLDLSSFANLEYLDCSSCTQMIDCTWCGLKHLKLPYNLMYLKCSRNVLDTLDLPDTIFDVEAQYNKIRTITFFTEDGTPTSEPQYLQALNLENNYIESLHFKPPDSLDVLQIGYNGSTGSKLTIPDIDPKLAKIAQLWNPPRVY